MARPSSVFALVCAAVLLGAALATSSGTRIMRAMPLEGYSVEYRVTDLAAGVPTSHIETVEIRRPYDGRTQTFRSGDVVTGKVTNRTFELQLTAGGKVQFAVRRQPGGPIRYVSYAALVDAAEAGVIDVVGAGEVDGRSCTWFSFGAPFPQALSLPGDERVDACIEASGILLREVWTIGERVVRETELVGMERDAPSPRRFFEGIDPEDLDVAQPDADEILRGALVVSDERGLPEPSLRLDVPRGWQRDREAGIVLASPVDGSATQMSSHTYLAGDRLVIVERSTRADPAPWPDDGATIDAGPGVARIVFYASHVEIRIRTNDSGFARVSAPDRAIAEAFAEGLRAGD